MPVQGVPRWFVQPGCGCWKRDIVDICQQERKWPWDCSQEGHRRQKEEGGTPQNDYGEADDGRGIIWAGDFWGVWCTNTFWDNLNIIFVAELLTNLGIYFWIILLFLGIIIFYISLFFGHSLFLVILFLIFAFSFMG